MFSICAIAKLVLVFSFNYLEASDNINYIINEMNNSINGIKNKYILIKHDIHSPENSVNTNYDTYLDSLIVLSNQLYASRYEISEKIIDLDIESKHADKISNIKLKSELLNNSISVLYLVNQYHSASFRTNNNLFEDYKAEVERLNKFEKLLHQME